MKFFNKKRSAEFSVSSKSSMSLAEKSVYFVLLSLFVVYSLRYFLWWINPTHIPANFLFNTPGLAWVNILLFLGLTVVLFLGLCIRAGNLFTVFFMRKPVYVAPEKGLKVAFLTCFVPGKEPLHMLEETLSAMKQAEYPHDTWVLDEGNDSRVRRLCKELGVLHFTRSGIHGYNSQSGTFKARTKAGNLNSWRNEFEKHYDVIAQLDMDHKPQKNYLMRILGYFKDSKVAFVGIPQVYKNTDNWIARGASEQTHFFYGPLQQGLYGSHMPSFTGTAHTYRVKAMEHVGGYAPSIAEDYLTGMHFFSNGWKGVYVPEALAFGVGPTTWADYFNQQMRWSYGLFEILFRHTHKHIFKMSLLKKFNLAFSQLFYFSGIASFLAFVLTTIYLIFGVNPANVNVTEWFFYSTPPFLLSTYIGYFLHKYYINPNKEPIFGWRGLLLGQGASLIYVMAFISLVLGRRLSYKVTTKDSNLSKDSISIFWTHLLIFILTSLALVIGLVRGNDSAVMRFWAFSTTILFAFVMLSIFVKEIKEIRSAGKSLLLRLFKGLGEGAILTTAGMFIFILLSVASSRVGLDRYASNVSSSMSYSIVNSARGEATINIIVEPGEKEGIVVRKAILAVAIGNNVTLSEDQVEFAVSHYLSQHGVLLISPGSSIQFVVADLFDSISASY